MVAVIKTGKALSKILHYNEHKVKEGVAHAIGAFNYFLEINQLSLRQKLNRLTRLASLNDRVTANSFHVSLNFHPSDKLDQTKLLAIAQSYMKRIGFGDQPFLVYQHRDAGHPHIHIVSVRVRADGSRIDVHNLARNESELARKVIERFFELTTAEGRGRKIIDGNTITAVPEQAVYGKKETKAVIAAVLQSVLSTYNFTSLPELNAVLGVYNVMADRGAKDSMTYRKGGLVYRIFDKNGKAKGVPVKASDFSFRPLLKTLETRFTANAAKRQFLTSNLRATIDQVVAEGSAKSLAEFAAELAKQDIHVVSRIAKTGQVYGLTYVDEWNKVVCNGSELGRGYSAAGITTRITPSVQRLLKEHPSIKEDAACSLFESIEKHILEGLKKDLLGIASILEPEHQTMNPEPFIPRKKKKKRQQRL